MRDLEGETALVTGASRGIGRQLALVLAARGVNLVLAARSEQELEQTAAAARARGVLVTVVPVDLADPQGPAELVERSLSEVGAIDVLINNAGVQCLGRFERTDPDTLLAALQLNLTTVLQLTRLLLPGMLARDRGHVATIGSMTGKAGAAYNVVYSATKFGVLGMTQALRSEYYQSGVGFTVVLPGIVRDEGMAAWLQDVPNLRARRLLGTTTPLRVAHATVRAIERNLPEIVVNPTPVRPLLAVAALAPRSVEPITRIVGVPTMYRNALAHRDQAHHKSPGPTPRTHQPTSTSTLTPNDS